MTQAKVQTKGMVALFEGEEARNEALGYIHAMIGAGFWPAGTRAVLTVGVEIREFVA